MNKETELYFRNLNELFRSEGWLQLIEEFKANAAAINSVEHAKDEQDLFFRKGQLNILANVLNLETQVEAARQQAEEAEVDA